MKALFLTLAVGILVTTLLAVAIAGPAGDGGLFGHVVYPLKDTGKVNMMINKWKPMTNYE